MGRIAVSSWNEMNVRMKYGLTGGLPAIYSDVDSGDGRIVGKQSRFEDSD
jgi:hypothetical protein